MTSTNTSPTQPHSPHVALLPSAGMGHLLPYLRLAAMLAARAYHVTVISAHPTLTIAETDQLSSFFAIHPHIHRIDYHILPYQKSDYINQDPFFIQFEAIANSIHLLRPILSSLSPFPSAIISDFTILSGINQIAQDLHVPTYTLIITSARFFCLMANLPCLALDDNADSVELPVIGKIPVSSIPPPMFNPKHFFAACIHMNVPSLSKVKGILLNTLASYEPEAIEALNSNSELGPILPVGPLQPFPFPGEACNVPWLDEQAPESVFYVSFGNRSALSKDQIQELALGLEKSGCKFLWVIKGSIVDKDDKEQVEEMVGEAFLARTRMQGLVVKGWVDQDQILAHPSVGAYLSHCGWNSVMEAARLGVPILAWPQGGDHWVAAEVAEKMGLVVWDKEWGWMGKKLVGKDEIADKVIEVMKDKNLRGKAKEIKEKATEAWDVNGVSELIIQSIIDHSLIQH